jgi:PKD domain
VIRRAVIGLLVAAAVLVAAGGVAEGKRFAGVVPDRASAGAAPRTLAADSARTGPARRLAPLASDLPYGGGPVLHTNRTHIVFWQPSGARNLIYPAGYRTRVERFLGDVAADSHRSSNVYSLSGQYRDSSGPAAYDSSYGGAVVATDPLPRNGCGEPLLTGPAWGVCLSDSQIDTELRRVIGAHGLPVTGRDVYFVVLPDGFGACEGSGPDACALGGTAAGSFCGYHTTSSDGTVLYAVIPFNAVSGHCQSANPRPNASPADPAISTISHEHNEIVTDPFGDAWVDSAGNEEADLCISEYGPDLGGTSAAWNQVIHGDHYYLQSEWSDWDGACEARAQPDSASFDQPSRPSAGTPVSFLAHAHAAHGSVVAYSWYFGDHGTARRRTPRHTYRRAGSYRVVLRITDSAGLWSYYARTITVAKARPSGKAKPPTRR